MTRRLECRAWLTWAKDVLLRGAGELKTWTWGEIVRGALLTGVCVAMGFFVVVAAAYALLIKGVS